MTIETSLISLYDAVKDGIKLYAGSKVILPTKEEAEIYGFMAIEDDMISFDIDMPPLGKCHILSNRAIFCLDKLYRFPIFKSVCMASEEKYNLYLLYIPEFYNLSSEWDRKAYVESIRREKPNPRVSKIEGIQIEENVAYYYSNHCDLYFESRSKLRGIGQGFVVVTRRISKPSDNIKYEVFDSYTVMIERNEKNP